METNIIQKMNAKELYKDYNMRVQDYMDNVIKCLEQDYGLIPQSWRISIDLIADNYAIYLQAKDNIEKEGMFHKDRHGNKAKNPAVLVMNQAQMQLRDLLKSFSLTPMSRAKMKQLDKVEKYNEDDYIDSLCS